MKNHQTAIISSVIGGLVVAVIGLSIAFIHAKTPPKEEIEVESDTETSSLDSIAPILSSRFEVIRKTSTSVTLSWNEASDNIAVSGYDVLKDGRKVASDISGTEYTVGGLSKNTSYEFTIQAKDAAGNPSLVKKVVVKTLAEDTTVIKDTSAPAISALSISSVSTSTAVISWSTDELSDSQVEYGKNISYGIQSPLLSAKTLSHSVQLSSLAADTKYHIRVKSKDAAGNLATSLDLIFTTGALPDTKVPAISDVRSDRITATSARIRWTTDEMSTSQIEFGTSTRYGSTTPLVSEKETDHSISLSGLTGSKTYHFRVKSKDVAGNTAQSADYTFITLAAPDTASPVISSISASEISATGAFISWTTDENSDSQIEYGLSDTYGMQTTIDAGSAKTHALPLTNLQAAKTYHFRVKSRDAAGNLATSDDRTFTTSAAPDTIAPTISNVTITHGTTWITISWTTNELSDTHLIYNKSGESSHQYDNSSLVTEHTVELTGLDPDATYETESYSKDAAGNKSLSDTRSTDTDSLPIQS